MNTLYYNVLLPESLLDNALLKLNASTGNKTFQAILSQNYGRTNITAAITTVRFGRTSYYTAQNPAPTGSQEPTVREGKSTHS